ncbi:transcription termination factor 4, mitochondrial [Callospermophilus lateralis]|uniref:transcription termination factor 4, mitochondrial n=1 Tax=Callospermophilus lateralis TaxID=76772 RepID=UPI0040389447
MAALGRQVLGGRRLAPLSWACLARRTSHPPERGRTKQTTASHGGSLEEAFRVGPRNYVQQPGCGTNPVQCLPEKQSTPVDSGSLEPEKVIGSLLDMGFSDAHVKDLLSTLPGANLQQLLDIVSELILLGLNPEPVCMVLKKSPQLLKLPVVQMKKRSNYLRKLGLGEGKLRRMLHGCPEVFTMRQQDIDDIVKLLKEKCLFTAQQVTEILHRCPGVLQEDPSELEYKFQYAYFRMGVQHLDIVRTDFLQYSVNKIKQRHSYLERLGRYQTPDKKGQTQITNPLLKDILRVSESEFLAKTACSSAEEFGVFKKLLAREEEEEQEEEEEPESSTSEDREEQL